MKILNRMKFVIGLLSGFVFLVALCSFSSVTENYPVFKIDTISYSLHINGKKIKKSGKNELFNALRGEFRKIEKANKTLYIFDKSGFVVEESQDGISVLLFYTKGEKENNPLSEFQGKLILNKLEILPSTSLMQIGEQLPDADKTIVMDDILLYAGKKFVLSGESKNGMIKVIDFGFKNK